MCMRSTQSVLATQKAGHRPMRALALQATLACLGAQRPMLSPELHVTSEAWCSAGGASAGAASGAAEGPEEEGPEEGPEEEVLEEGPADDEGPEDEAGEEEALLSEAEEASAAGVPVPVMLPGAPPVVVVVVLTGLWRLLLLAYGLYTPPVVVAASLRAPAAIRGVD